MYRAIQDQDINRTSHRQNGNKVEIKYFIEMIENLHLSLNVYVQVGHIVSDGLLLHVCRNVLVVREHSF